jgi:hypothetical protein
MSAMPPVASELLRRDEPPLRATNRHACLSGDGNQQEWEDLDALAVADDAAVQMIDTSIVRVHQHGACLARNHERRPQSVPLVR